MHPTVALALTAALSLPLAFAGFDLAFRGNDADLTSFVTRPEIKVPIFDINITSSADAILPGYWFLAPYADIQQQTHARNYYQACQTGPVIYDGTGQLVWNGACKFRNQGKLSRKQNESLDPAGSVDNVKHANAVDFKRFTGADGAEYMSAILYVYGNDTKGHGVVLDSNYKITHEMHAPVAIENFNMHELQVLPPSSSASQAGRPQRTTALHFVHRPSYVDVRDLKLNGTEAGWVGDVGFREADLTTGETLFEWWPLNHLSVAESYTKVEASDLKGPPPKSWNWFHGNSVDKNDEGDYIVSSRYTDCIYKISGRDGSVIWRFGGKKSDFILEGFNFSRQHDARWLSYDDDVEVVSFLDNGADSISNHRTSNISSALIVKLDKRAVPPTATVLKRIWRPDGKLSRLRGNFQTFKHSDNVIVGWSDNSYVSEHDGAGNVLLEGRFRSERFVTYRAYKFNFTGTPEIAPIVKGFVYGTESAKATTVVYVSWNGATEAAAWNFYRCGVGGGEPVLLGMERKTGFETKFQADGYSASVFAEALDAKGGVLGRSEAFEIPAPDEWSESSIEEPLKHVDGDEQEPMKVSTWRSTEL